MSKVVEFPQRGYRRSEVLRFVAERLPRPEGLTQAQAEAVLDRLLAELEQSEDNLKLTLTTPLSDEDRHKIQRTVLRLLDREFKRYFTVAAYYALQRPEDLV
jgi:hypothetical protein